MTRRRDNSGAASGQVVSAMRRLADVSSWSGDADAFIGDVLALLAESLDVGLALLSRVDGDNLHIVRTHDRAGMGIRAGDVMPLCDTY